ncbi:high affinity copper uptake protein 1 [Drosophila eugracilis]|uniref:high affinity copper uptake protein 1 n=1 Tax=Drosophila eugracilis TaxID=29029 RepID=UPI0007E67492|nr:high affinity copper uptake protein 1 [Drosophila eugracilis]
MNHHGADAPAVHVHHHGLPTASGPSSTAHEGHHSPAMSHQGDHGGHGETKHGNHVGEGHEMVMAMFFHTGDTETILFKFWRTESALALTLSCLLIFLMAVLYEGLKFFREWLYARNRKRRLAGGTEHYNPPRRYREANYNYNQPTYPSRTNQHTGTQIYAYRPRSASVSQLPPAAHAPSPDQSSLMLNPPHHHHHHIQQNDPSAVGSPRLKAWCSRMHLLQTLLHVLQVFISFLLMLVFMTFNVWLCVAVLLGAGFGYYIFCAFKTDVQEHCN